MTEEKKEAGKQTGAALTAENVIRRIIVPKVDIYETKDSVVVMADMPGVDADSLEVTLEKDVLAIRGTAAVPAGTERRIVHSEHGAGEYRRVFRISDEVDREKIDATIKNGLLSLTLHKVEPFKARKISIKAA